MDGAALARLAQDLAAAADHGQAKVVAAYSARNRFTGLVTRVVRGTVMAQVEIRPGRTASYRCSAARPPTSSAWCQACSRSPRSRPPASR